MKRFSLIATILFIMLFSYSCIDNSNTNTMELTKNLVYVKYFYKRTIKPSKDFKYMYSMFEGEIQGDTNELLLNLKAIETVGQTFYKVFYNTKNQIIRYKLLEQGKLRASTIYHYGPLGTSLSNKVIKIDYYNEQSNIIASDKITYNKLGRPIKTLRFKTNGNTLINLF